MKPCPAQRQITELGSLVSTLPDRDQARFEQIFGLGTTIGRTAPPEAMKPWIEKQFGSVDAVRQQRIIKVTNLVTLEGALFNELRARRPIEAPSEDELLEEIIQEGKGGAFCRPEEGTPADTFGRLRGKHALTASNVAKYDGWHGVIVFDEHHPLHFTREQVADYVDTAQRWAQKAHKLEPAACYPFFLWNCLWKAGASILHGHAQMVLGQGMHYAKVEAWRRAARRYRASYGTNYFDDLLAVHRALDLAVEHGRAAILPSLTPLKEKETLIVSQRLDNDLKSAIALVLSTMIEGLGVQSFNVALYQPPLADTPENWAGFPHVARIVDRGSLQSKTADVAAMELFGQSIVTTDPFRLVEALRDSVEHQQRSSLQGGSQ
jgi:galactose-1-phosphate uridylyltransferase